MSPASNQTRIIPLGGLGEIGMNCLAIEANREILVVDCGVTFPHSDLGIDVYHPDFSYLEAHRDQVVGVVITHGHEDHIGGLPFLLSRVRAPVYAPRHALGLIRERLEERGFDLRQMRLHPMTPGEHYGLGAFSVEPIHVTHSIVDACSLVIKHPNATIVHTGDFKFDPTPTYGPASDLKRLREVGDEGVDLLLSDSTNIDTAGSSGSEKDVAESLEELISTAPARAIVGMFSSNVPRLRTVAECAHRHGRKLVLLGRSVNNHVRVATQHGHLELPSDLLVPAELVATIAPSKLVAIASGTQAERAAALASLARGGHQALRLRPGDRVIMSSRIIPGHDPEVYSMIGAFIQQDVEVVTRMTAPKIHVSGHACRDEQAMMIDLIRPRCFMPVHGTHHHLLRHANLARDKGIEHVLMASNGDVVALTSTGVERVDWVETGKVPTWGGEAIDDAVIRQREWLARSGIVLVTLTLDKQGNLRGLPQISTRGILAEEETQTLRDIAETLRDGLSRRPYVDIRKANQDILADAERLVRRAFDGLAGRRPTSVIHVVRS